MSEDGRQDQAPWLQEHWTRQGWEEAAGGVAAVAAAFRAQAVLQARIDAVLKPLDLTYARFELLLLLDSAPSGALPPAAAAERLNVHATSVTHTVERLGRLGLVERLPHPTDGRANLVSLTPQGRDLALQAARELNREVFTRLGLTPGRLAEFTALAADLCRLPDDVASSQPAPPAAPGVAADPAPPRGGAGAAPANDVPGRAAGPVRRRLPRPAR